MAVQLSYVNWSTVTNVFAVLSIINSSKKMLTASQFHHNFEEQPNLVVDHNVYNNAMVETMREDSHIRCASR